MALLADLLDAVEAARDELVQLHQELVRIPTVNTGRMPTGNETPAARLVQDRLRREGIDTEVLESAPNRGNLIAGLPGVGGGPRLLYMSHLDVVPVEDEAHWIAPPFAAEIIDGRVYGRGATDCKSLVAAEALVLILLKRAGVRLRGDLIFASGADEEAGGEYGFGWLVRHVPAKVRADFAINEGGGAPTRSNRGLTYLLPVGEKGRLEARLTIPGRSYHASQPWRGENALYGLARAVQRLQDYQPEIAVDAPIFRHLDLFGVAAPVTAENIDHIVAQIAAEEPNLGSVLRALSRMTHAPTVVQGGAKSNVIPERAVLTCDVRTLPHQDDAYVRRVFADLIADIPGAQVDIEYTAVPSASPYETDFAARVREATELALGQPVAAWAPSLTTGFTDSRFLRPLGTIVYDFAAMHPDTDVSKLGAHTTNESEDIASVLTRAKMLMALAVLTLGVAE